MHEEFVNTALHSAYLLRLKTICFFLSNNIVNLPAELNHNEGRAFYLLVFALENGAYCQQILYSFKGLIFYRAITGANSAFTQWKKLT